MSQRTRLLPVFHRARHTAASSSPSTPAPPAVPGVPPTPAGPPTTMRDSAPEAQARPVTRRVLDAVDERLGLDALRYPVPEHANNLAWSLGGLTAVSLVLLVLTGIVMAQYYDPTPEVANASVRSLVSDVQLGRYVRGVHYWSAQAMYVLAALHLIRVFFHGSYKRPREANWLIGVSMFGLTLLALFTGTVLKWDQEGYEALGHNVELGQVLGGFGFWFSPAMAAHTPLLVRLYSAHILLIPGLIVLLLVVHALLIRRHKISSHPALEPDPVGAADTGPFTGPAHGTPEAVTSRGGEAGEEMPRGASAPEPAVLGEAVARDVFELREPFTHHLRRVGAFGLVLLGVLSVLAIVFPPPVGPTPIAGVEVTKPMWPFWWMFTLENWFGLPAILWGGLALFALLFAVPFIDRGPRRSWRQRPVAMVVGGLVLVALVVLTVLMAVTVPATHL